MLKPIEQHLICTDATYICTEETMKALDFPLFRYYAYLTANTTEIIQRQRLFECILNSKEVLDILYYFREQITILADLVKQTGNLDSGETEGLLYSIKELLIFTDTIDLISEKSCKLPKDLSSNRLLGLLSEICDIAADEQYIGIKKWLSSYASSLRNLHSITLGVNLDAQLNAKEVGIVSFNETPYMRTKGIDGFIRSQKASDNFSCLCSLGIKEAGLTERNALAINREFFAAMNQTMKRSARSIKKLLNDSLQKTLLSLISLKEEVNFLINCSNYFQNCIGTQMPLCFPKIGEKTVLKKLYNPLLLSVCSPAKIIPASFIPNNDQQIFILTGPNSGGKTSYIKSLGFAWLSFQLGLPVTAMQAQMKPMNRIITHFVEKSNKHSEGRLANESSRLRDSIENITEHTLFLLDETFSGTNSYDAVIFSEALIKYLAKLPYCYTVYITHLLELNDRLQRLKTNTEYTNITLLVAGIQNGKRSYEIIPYQESVSIRGFAMDIIIENGLGFLFDDPKM